MRRADFLLNLLLKSGLAALLLAVLARPEVAELSGRGLAGRVVLGTTALIAIPFGWWLTPLRNVRPYPYALDALLAAPFVLELSGRIAGLPEVSSRWDVVTHVASWMFLVLAIGLVLESRVPARLVLAALCLGFGATTAILWELAEYAAGVHELHDTIYQETLSDLASALAASAVAAAFVAVLAAPARRARRGTSRRAPRAGRRYSIQ